MLLRILVCWVLLCASNSIGTANAASWAARYNNLDKGYSAFYPLGWRKAALPDFLAHDPPVQEEDVFFLRVSQKADLPIMMIWEDRDAGGQPSHLYWLASASADFRQDDFPIVAADRTLCKQLVRTTGFYIGRPLSDLPHEPPIFRQTTYFCRQGTNWYGASVLYSKNDAAIALEAAAKRVALSFIPYEMPPKTAFLVPGTMHSWNGGGNGPPRRYSAEGVTLTISEQASGQFIVAVLTARARDGRTVTVRGVESILKPQAVEFGIGRIDSTGIGQDILFVTRSGGAHCCVRPKVILLTATGWKVIDLGWKDGGSLPGDVVAFPQPIGPSGHVPVFVFPDQTFIYAYDGYAADHMPPRAYEVRGGRLHDVSASAQYRDLFEKDIVDARASCLRHENSGCAAFVADAARLHRFREAWAILLKNYQPNYHWGWPMKCDASNRCYNGYHSLLEALSAHLVAQGYVSRSAIPN